jgi:hypothetical protein
MSEAPKDQWSTPERVALIQHAERLGVFDTAPQPDAEGELSDRLLPSLLKGLAASIRDALTNQRVGFIGKALTDAAELCRSLGPHEFEWAANAIEKLRDAGKA